MPKTFTVDYCCCCVRLETGGLIIAWLHLIVSIVSSIVNVVYIVTGAMCRCDGIAAERDGKSYCLTDKKSNDFPQIEETHCTANVVEGSIFLPLCVVGAIISWICIKGIQTRNPSYVKPMVIFLVVLAALSIPLMIVYSPVYLIDLFVDAYFFLIMYSLYILFQGERERGSNSVQYGNV